MHVQFYGNPPQKSDQVRHLSVSNPTTGAVVCPCPGVFFLFQAKEPVYANPFDISSFEAAPFSNAMSTWLEPLTHFFFTRELSPSRQLWRPRKMCSQLNIDRRTFSIWRMILCNLNETGDSCFFYYYLQDLNSKFSNVTEFSAVAGLGSYFKQQ